MHGPSMPRPVTRYGCPGLGFGGSATKGPALVPAPSPMALHTSDTDIRIVTGLRATVQSITSIGTRAGVFRKHGLEVTFPSLEVGGPATVAGLRNGDWEFAQTGAVPVAESVLAGSDAVILLRNHDQ